MSSLRLVTSSVCLLAFISSAPSLLRADGPACDPLDPLCGTIESAPKPAASAPVSAPEMSAPQSSATGPQGIQYTPPDLRQRKADVNVTVQADGYAYDFTGQDKVDGGTLAPKISIYSRPVPTKAPATCDTPFIQAIVDTAKPIAQVRQAYVESLRCRNSCLEDKDLAFLADCRDWGIIQRGREGVLSEAEELALLEGKLNQGCSQLAIDSAIRSGKLSGNYKDGSGSCELTVDSRMWWMRATIDFGRWDVAYVHVDEPKEHEGLLIGSRFAGIVDMIDDRNSGFVHAIGFVIAGRGNLSDSRYAAFAPVTLTQATLQYQAHPREDTDRKVIVIPSAGATYTQDTASGQVGVHQIAVHTGVRISSNVRDIGVALPGEPGTLVPVGGAVYFQIHGRIGNTFRPTAAAGEDGSQLLLGATAEAGGSACTPFGSNTTARFCVHLGVNGIIDLAGEISTNAVLSLPVGFAFKESASKVQGIYVAPNVSGSYGVFHGDQAESIQQSDGSSHVTKYNVGVSIGGSW